MADDTDEKKAEALRELTKIIQQHMDEEEARRRDDPDYEEILITPEGKYRKP
ncbi:MAG: hypothetical protein WCC87_14450 [Candidatus Korobacteraceae bacterium]